MNRPVPVTLVTGFLGAGKTTLVNHVLRGASGRRIAVIENEFGDLGVDCELLETSPDALFELTDGCVCCSVRADLIHVFETLMDDSFDHVLIEASGLADPAPVMTLLDMPQFDGFRLAGVVTVVDAANLQASLLVSETCARQVAYADLLVLNKSDVVDRSTMTSLVSRLKALNPLAHHLWVERGRVPLHLVFEPTADRLPTKSLPIISDAHDHDQSLGAVMVEVDGNVDAGALDGWLGRLLGRPDIDVLRMKGILAIQGFARRFVVQSVRQAVDVRPMRPWGDEERVTRLVFIGRGLSTEALQEGLSACRA